MSSYRVGLSVYLCVKMEYGRHGRGCEGAKTSVLRPITGREKSRDGTGSVERGGGVPSSGLLPADMSAHLKARSPNQYSTPLSFNAAERSTESLPLISRLRPCRVVAR